MSIKIFLDKPYSRKDETIINIAKELFNELGDIVVGLETHESWDGSNLRILVKDDTSEIIDKVLNIVYKIIEKHNAYGEIIPEIVKVSDTIFFTDMQVSIPQDALRTIERSLREHLPNIFIHVEPTESWDGSNLRILVKDDSSEIIDKVLSIVYKIVAEYKAYGKIIPEIVKADENV